MSACALSSMVAHHFDPRQAATGTCSASRLQLALPEKQPALRVLPVADWAPDLCSRKDRAGTPGANSDRLGRLHWSAAAAARQSLACRSPGTEADPSALTSRQLAAGDSPCSCTS